jgi:hypothetical protein
VQPDLSATEFPATATRRNLFGLTALAVSVVGIVVACILGAIAIAVRSSPTAALVLMIVGLGIDLVLEPIACFLGIAGLSRPGRSKAACIVAICFSLAATIVGAVAGGGLLLTMLAGHSVPSNFPL